MKESEGSAEEHACRTGRLRQQWGDGQREEGLWGGGGGQIEAGMGKSTSVSTMRK